LAAQGQVILCQSVSMMRWDEVQTDLRSEIKIEEIDFNLIDWKN
jgi:hypothetical protein